MRRLNAEEQALWDKVAATIRPLSRTPARPSAAPDAVPTKVAPPSGPSPRTVAQPKPAPAKPVTTHRTATLDGGWDRRLSSGRVEPDRILDLHGHNLNGAWSSIDRGLERAIAAGDRVILLITGHERKGEPPLERGKIRAVVHDWLAHSRHAGSIAAVRNAHRRHGGGGSLYIILRRR